MSARTCPLCFGPVEAIDVAPCWDCGHDPVEIEHLRNGKHSYAEYVAFGELPVILCNYCFVDFGSYSADYFGLPSRSQVGQVLDYRRDVDPATVPRRDAYCPSCGHRRTFLEFVAAAVELHRKQSGD